MASHFGSPITKCFPSPLSRVYLTVQLSISLCLVITLLLWMYNSGRKELFICNSQYILECSMTVLVNTKNAHMGFKFHAFLIKYYLLYLVRVCRWSQMFQKTYFIWRWPQVSIVRQLSGFIEWPRHTSCEDGLKSARSIKSVVKHKRLRVSSQSNWSFASLISNEMGNQ